VAFVGCTVEQDTVNILLLAESGEGQVPSHVVSEGTLASALYTSTGARAVASAATRTSFATPVGSAFHLGGCNSAVTLACNLQASGSVTGLLTAGTMHRGNRSKTTN